MPRRIRTATLQTTGGGQVDRFFDRVLKYIPADVVGGWIAVTGIIASDAADPNRQRVLWIVFAVGLILTAAWTYAQTREPGAKPATVQIIIATAAFAVWVFALGGPFVELDWYRQSYGSILLIGFTLAVGLVVPK